MKIIFEILGAFVVSSLFIAIIILCTLSFVYGWIPGLKFILSVASFLEWLGLIILLSNIADEKD